MTASLLLVTPGFHGYWRSIAAALSRRGYAVTTHVYDRAPLARRLRDKVGRELPHRLGRTAWIPDDQGPLATARVRQVRPDVLLVVKGDTLGAAFWEAAQGVHRRGLWMYDELRRTAHDEASLTAAGPIASYSPLDVEGLRTKGLDAIHVPLAHDPTLAFTARPSREVSFVGARYANRETLLTALHAAGVPVRAYGRDWSGHPVDRARTWRLRTPALPAGRDLSRGAAYGVMAGSAATLNIHGDQDGFTMRTFEAAGVGAVELVDRPDVSTHYDPGTEVLVFSSAEEAVELARRALAEPTWAARVRRAGVRRTLAEHTFDHRALALESLWA